MQQINKHLFCASRCFHCLPLWSVSSLCQPPKYRDRLNDRGKKTYTHTHHLSLGSVIHSVMDLLYFCANFACRVFCFFYVDTLALFASSGQKKIHHPFCGFSLMFTSLWKLMHVLNFSPSSAIYTGVMHVKIGTLKIGLSVKWETSRAQVSVKSIAIDGICCLEKYRAQFSTVLSSGVFPFCLTSSLE